MSFILNLNKSAVANAWHVMYCENLFDLSSFYLSYSLPYFSPSHYAWSWLLVLSTFSCLLCFLNTLCVLLFHALISQFVLSATSVPSFLSFLCYICTPGSLYFPCSLYPTMCTRYTFSLRSLYSLCFLHPFCSDYSLSFTCFFWSLSFSNNLTFSIVTVNLFAPYILPLLCVLSRYHLLFWFLFSSSISSLSLLFATYLLLVTFSCYCFLFISVLSALVDCLK